MKRKFKYGMFGISTIWCQVWGTDFRVRQPSRDTEIRNYSYLYMFLGISINYYVILMQRNDLLSLK